MRRPSIRAGLTAWFVGLTALLLGTFSGTLYFGIGRALRRGLDAELRVRAEALVALCEWEEDIGGVEFELTPEAAAELTGGRAERGLEVWVWPERRLLHRSGAAIAAPLPEASPDLDGGRPVVVYASSRTPAARRLCTLRAGTPAVSASDTEPARPAFEVLVRVTDSLASIEAQLAQVAGLILGLAVFSLLVVVAFGLFLSRRFVAPLRELGHAAAEVRARRKARIPRRGNEDELDRLAGILDEAFASLEQALERQTRFTADAAHELRNPISVIRSAAEVALRRERSSAEYREFLTDVLFTAERMGGIVEALLLLARMDAGVVPRTFAEVDLSALVRESAAELPEGCERVLVADGAPALVRGEAGLLRILVENLLSNALRYSGAGEPVEVRVAQDDCRVSLSVRDRGPGVPDSETGRLFERFRRLEPANPGAAGAGLGLAIVSEVARVHSADCRMEGAEPGTRVTVVFPAAELAGGRVRPPGELG